MKNCMVTTPMITKLMAVECTRLLILSKELFDLF